MIPAPATPGRRVLGRIDAWPIDGEWVLVFEDNDEKQHDLGEFATPGAAVDAAYAWAKGRAVMLTTPSVQVWSKP